MTQFEAKQALSQGLMVRHRYFATDEWVTYKDGKCLFEDGNICEISEFWWHRRDEAWQKDWSLV